MVSTYTQLDDGTLPTFPFTLPPEGKSRQLVSLTSVEPASPSVLLHKTKKHLVLIRRQLYSLAFVPTPFTSALVFDSESNVLTKAACRVLFPRHDLSAL